MGMLLWFDRDGDQAQGVSAGMATDTTTCTNFQPMPTFGAAELTRDGQHCLSKGSFAKAVFGAARLIVDCRQHCWHDALAKYSF